MKPGPPRIRRPRPVADAPIDPLLARAEDLAKGWLLALLEQAPLDDAPAILAAELPSHGPRVCDAIVRALASDDDLRRLEAGGALHPLIERAADLVGARDVQAAVRAVDVLQAVIWSAVREELSYPQPDQVSELAERLALVIELVRGAALGPGVERRAPVAEPHSSAELEPAPERADVPPPPAGPEPPHGDEPAAPAGPSEARLDLPHLVAPPPAGARTAESGALWLSALEDEVNRASGAGTQLALLLAELDDADRVLAAEGDRTAGATFGRFAQAVRAAVRRHDILACETDTRAWIIARDTGREGAQALGSRIATAVSDTEPWRGAPLRVSVGLAVLGEDGKDSAQLVEVAEESMYAAASSGIGVLRAAPPPSPAEGA